MKTPDEIKKGLEQYMSVDAYDCEISCKDSGCPYRGDERIGAETCGDLICADALAYIQQLEAKVPKWISVEERLPEPYMGVLVRKRSINKVVCFMAIDHLEEYGGQLVWDGGATGKYIVTHWMPLPEPPEV